MIPFLFAQIQPVELTNVNQIQQEFIIDGGELAGDNIFHTFEQFNLDQGQIAEFLANPQTRNIFNRVIGGDPSIIDGILKITGGSPDFYFLNPNGIVFGRNAYIDVPAAFYGSTASSVQFGNSGFPRYRQESEWFASPIAEDRIGLVSEISDLDPSFLAFQTLTNPIINLGTIQAGGRIDLSGSSIVSLGSLNAPEINFSLIKLSYIGYKVSIEDDFWTILTRTYIPINFLSYQNFYRIDDIQVHIGTDLGSRTVFVDYFDLESFNYIEIFDIGVLDSLSNQNQEIFRLGGIGDDFSYDLNLAIYPDLPDDPIVDIPDDSVMDIPDDPIVDIPDDSVMDIPDDPIVDTPDDSVMDIPDDPIVDTPDDSVMDIPDDSMVNMLDDSIVDELANPIVNELDDLIDNFQIDKVDFSFWDISKSPNEEVNFILSQPRICYYPQLIYGDFHCLLRLNVQNQNYPNELTEQQFQIFKRGE
jgi:filamentous hemagglutinin family protein